MVKPFDMKELSARVKSVLRRYQTHANRNDEDVIKFDNIEISLSNHELKIKGQKKRSAGSRSGGSNTSPWICSATAYPGRNLTVSSGL